jgi:hypothetical protein
MGDIQTLADFYGEMAATGVRLMHQFQIKFFVASTAQEEMKKQVSQLAIDSLINVSYFTEGSSIPGVVLNQTEVKYLGTKVVVPTTTEFTNMITLSLRCDANSNIRNALMAWKNYHSNINIVKGTSLDIASSGGGNKKIPSSTATLSLLRDDLDPSNIVETYTLFGVFPKEVGPMAIDQTSNEVAKFDFNLAYQYFQIENGAGKTI